MATNTFGTKFGDSMFFFWSLELLGGYLAVISTDFSAQIHVCTMRESKAEQKWSKIISITDNHGFCYTISAMVMYKINDNNWLGFDSGFMPGYQDWGFENVEFQPYLGAKIGPYVESLILPEDM